MAKHYGEHWRFVCYVTFVSMREFLIVPFLLLFLPTGLPSVCLSAEVRGVGGGEVGGCGGMWVCGGMGVCVFQGLGLHLPVRDKFE